MLYSILFVADPSLFQTMVAGIMEYSHLPQRVSNS